MSESPDLGVIPSPRSGSSALVISGDTFMTEQEKEALASDIEAIMALARKWWKRADVVQHLTKELTFLKDTMDMYSKMNMSRMDEETLLAVKQTSKIINSTYAMVQCFENCLIIDGLESEINKKIKRGTGVQKQKKTTRLHS